VVPSQHRQFNNPLRNREVLVVFSEPFGEVEELPLGAGRLEELLVQEGGLVEDLVLSLEDVQREEHTVRRGFSARVS
jgi:hypothetical protein